jgi:hypothetical protein
VLEEVPPGFSEDRCRAGRKMIERRGYGHAGSIVRVVLVPLLDHPLLEAATLEERELPDERAAAARAARLASQSEGITPHVSAAGIRLHVGEQRAARKLSIGANGEITVEASVGGDDHTFAWRTIDRRNEVQEVAVTLAIPEAQHKSWGRGRGSNTISMGGMFSLPETAIAPEPARVLRRADLAREETVRGLAAEMRRLFADAGAVDEG